MFGFRNANVWRISPKVGSTYALMAGPKATCSWTECYLSFKRPELKMDYYSIVYSIVPIMCSPYILETIVGVLFVVVLFC